MILLNDHEIKFTTFPNGETFIESEQFRKATEREEKAGISIHTIKFKYEDDSDLIKLMFVKRQLDEFHSKAHLFMYYVPYSRMDRTEEKTVFTLKYVCDFINSLNFFDVHVFQPHSDVCSGLLDRSRIYNVSRLLLPKAVEEIGFNPETDYIYYPDASAEKHFSKTNNYKGLTGLKQRDFTTGNIVKLDVVGDLPKETGFKVIMIDDLCSRGGTFMMGAEKLIELGAGEIYLVVTHCENSIFQGDIFKDKLIDKVFTTNTIVNKELENERLKVYDIINNPNSLMS